MKPPTVAATGQPGPAWTDDPAYVAECEACLCLRHCPGLGPRTWKKLLRAHGTAERVLANVGTLKADGLCDAAVAESLAKGISLEPARRELERAATKGLTPLPWSHPAYPGRLRDIIDPPVLLYGLGDLALLSRPCLAVVGARRCSHYGFETAYRLAVDLAAAGVTVVSGLAFGIDRQAHLGGLTGPGGSIAVLGTGLDLVYPDANVDVWRELAQHGAIVSEFAPGTPPQAQNFPIRNRIIAGLSLGVMVVEAAARSGSLITARLALEQGREVFALPGPVNLPTFAGCHTLLASGATLVQSAEDILVALARELTESLTSAPAAVPKPAAAPKKPVTRKRATPPPAAAETVLPPEAGALHGLEKAVSDLLADGDKCHIDVLARRLGAAAGDLNRALVTLEIKGLVRKWPGMYYSRTGKERGATCKKFP